MQFLGKFYFLIYLCPHLVAFSIFSVLYLLLYWWALVLLIRKARSLFF